MPVTEYSPILRRSTTTLASPSKRLHAGDPKALGDVFGVLGDDEIRLVVEYLVDVRRDKRASKRERDRFGRAADDVFGLCSTCRYLRHFLYRGDSREVCREVLARRALDVRPRDIWAVSHPYHWQAKRMDATLVRIRALRQAETAMAFHCCSKHCAHARLDVFKSVQNEVMIVPMEECRVQQFSSSNAGRVFTHVRATRMDEHRHVSLPYSGLRVRQPDHVFDQVRDELWLGDVVADVLRMAASPDGQMVAYVVETLDDDTPEYTPYRLYVWAPGRNGNKPVVVSADGARNFDGITDLPGACFPQSLWWSTNGAGEQWLVVAWSTTWVHPSGIDEFGGAAVSADERYIVTSYDVGLFEEEGVQFSDGLGIFPGRLLAIKAAADGERYVAHVRQCPMRRWETHYFVRVHEFGGPAETLKHPSIWKCQGKRRAGKDGFDWGPSAVGISPMGDAVVCMHRTNGGIVAEVLDHVDGVNYTTTNSRDMTQWFTRNRQLDDLDSDDEGWGPEFGGSAHYFEDDDPFDIPPNAVKLLFDVGFTDCGAHACIVDRRPLHGSTAASFSTVLLDISKRRQVKHMRACPLYRMREAMPRAMEWGPNGVWVQGRRGLSLVAHKAPAPEVS